MLAFFGLLRTCSREQRGTHPAPRWAVGRGQARGCAHAYGVSWGGEQPRPCPVPARSEERR